MSFTRYIVIKSWEYDVCSPRFLLYYDNCDEAIGGIHKVTNIYNYNHGKWCYHISKFFTKGIGSGGFAETKESAWLKLKLMLINDLGYDDSLLELES